MNNFIEVNDNLMNVNHIVSIRKIDSSNNVLCYDVVYSVLITLYNNTDYSEEFLYEYDNVLERDNFYNSLKERIGNIL